MVYVIPVESSEVEHDKKVDSAKVMIVHHPPETIQGENLIRQYFENLKIVIFDQK